MGIEGESVDAFLFPGAYELFADSELSAVVRKLKSELDERLDTIERVHADSVEDAPSETKYLYFVARGGGRHTFSETLDQHREAIRAGR